MWQILFGRLSCHRVRWIGCTVGCVLEWCVVTASRTSRVSASSRLVSSLPLFFSSPFFSLFFFVPPFFLPPSFSSLPFSPSPLFPSFFSSHFFSLLFFTQRRSLHPQRKKIMDYLGSLSYICQNTRRHTQRSSKKGIRSGRDGSQHQKSKQCNSKKK